MKIRVQIENETYEVEVGDLTARPVIAVVDGETFEVYPEELQAAPAAAGVTEQQRPVRAAPAPAPPANKASDCEPIPPSSAQQGEKMVSAPIPGVILSISVKPGDQVDFGQELCMLEAMKMKNAIRAKHPGTIKAVHVAVGDTVRHGQSLIEYAD